MKLLLFYFFVRRAKLISLICLALRLIFFFDLCTRLSRNLFSQPVDNFKQRVACDFDPPGVTHHELSEFMKGISNLETTFDILSKLKVQIAHRLNMDLLTQFTIVAIVGIPNYLLKNIMQHVASICVIELTF